MVLVIVVVANFVPGIGYVVAFSGAAFGTTVGITVPALVYTKLSYALKDVRPELGVTMVHVGLGAALAVFGVAETLTSIAITITELSTIS